MAAFALAASPFFGALTRHHAPRSRLYSPLPPQGLSIPLASIVAPLVVLCIVTRSIYCRVGVARSPNSPLLLSHCPPSLPGCLLSRFRPLGARGTPLHRSGKLN